MLDLLDTASPPASAGKSGIRLCVLSLGAGVQSTTLALMAAHGEIGPMPDCAVFAETGWEPQRVYEHLAWLRSPNVLTYPVLVTLLSFGAFVFAVAPAPWREGGR